MTTNLFAEWTNQLLDYQRQYNDAWQALMPGENSLGLHNGGLGNANPWVTALDQWTKVVSSEAAPRVQDFYTRLVHQGKIYLQMTGALNATFQQTAATGDSAVQWQQAINDMLNGLRDIFSGRQPHAQGAAYQAVAFWELPLNMWQRALSSTSILPGDFLQNVNALGAAQVREELHGRVDQLLSTPTVGYMREHQEQIQALTKLNIDYQQALQDYFAAYGEIGVKCVEALQQNIQKRAAEGEAIISPRDLYDMWVDSCEEAYASYVTTDNYVEIFGRLVNSLMALKRHGSMIIGKVLSAMNMPTRGEMDTLQQRLQETRREGKALRAEIESFSEALRTEMESLQGQVKESGERAKPTGFGAANDLDGRRAPASTKAASEAESKSSTNKNHRTKLGRAVSRNRP